MKKGFTLIELLAVIVILAIIAVIAVPIVIDIIDDSKKNALLKTAEFYLDAVEMSIAQATLNNQNIQDGTYNILSSGNICLGYDNDNKCKGELVVEVKGENPTNGKLTITNGNISNVDFKISEKRIIKNSKEELIYFPCTLINGEENTIGSKYECEVSPGTKYNFYVLSYNNKDNESTNDKTKAISTNLIMDRNMCDDGTPTNANRTDKCLVEWISNGQNQNGPVTAMEYLNRGTSSWINIENLNIIYDDEGEIFTDFPITGKARMPYKSEVDKYNDDNVFLYNNLELKCYNERYSDVDCNEATIIMGIFNNLINHIKGISGYWILSAYSSSQARMVDFYGNVGVNNSELSYFGVRPVINLKL